MSDPFDPIDGWLGADIELMPPRAGAFEQIHRRARRRKTVVAISAAAGAAVLIAAAATLPQLVSVLQPGHGGGPYKLPSATSSSHSPRPGHRTSSTPAPRQSSCSAQPAQSNLYIGGPTKPPATAIAPSSVTFVSGTTGAVIGQTASGCEAVAATSNYGQTWSKIDPPPAGSPNGDSGVSQIRFLEATNGWAYGPELYSTHDGGATWNKIRGLPGRVIDLATVGGSAFAVVASCTGTGIDYATGCTSFSLYWSPYDSDSWRPVAGASGKYQVVPGGLQVTPGQEGYLLAGPALFTGSPSGGAWHRVTINSGTVPACLTGKGDKAAAGESGILAAPSSDVYLLCQPAGGGGGLLYTSTDAGATWQLDGHVKADGTATSLAVAPSSGMLVLATSAGIYDSPDARHWHRASLSGQVLLGGFGYVGMTTQMNGVAVPAGPGAPVIYITTDGGLRWHPRRIK